MYTLIHTYTNHSLFFLSLPFAYWSYTILSNFCCSIWTICVVLYAMMLITMNRLNIERRIATSK